jgi:hypothetical protein
MFVRLREIVLSKKKPRYVPVHVFLWRYGVVWYGVVCHIPRRGHNDSCLSKTRVHVHTWCCFLHFSRVFVQAHTALDAGTGKVSLKEYEASPEGLITSMLDRFAELAWRDATALPPPLHPFTA